MADRRPLMDEFSDPADTTNTPALPSLGFSPTSSSLGFAPIAHVSPPLSPRYSSRPGYTRLSSDPTVVEKTTPPTVVEEDEEDIAHSLSRQSTGGLGIDASASPPAPSRRVSVQTIPRRPLPSNARSPSIRSPVLSPPNTGDPFLGGFPHHSAESTPDLRRERFSPKHDSEPFRRGVLKHAGNSTTSLNNDYQEFLRSSHGDQVRNGAPSIKTAYETNFHPTHQCPTERPFYQSRFTWVSITIVIICLFSTVFSGIFLGLALKSPRYGRSISSQGSFKPADAILLTSVMAKLIELSFVTSFVAFLGQVLSRRAFMKDQGRGVTLSELSMWRWVVQPGTLITHWETAKYAGLSVLGLLSLLSAVLATLYTPAATALVQPMLKDGGKYGEVVLAGRVKTGFANVNYVKSICETPISVDMDKNNSGNTCLQIEHAGQGYHNYQRYLSTWKHWTRFGNGTSDQLKRPQGFGLLYENTTVTGQWINVINTTEESKKHGRAINKVSLAMPHASVFSAARYGENNIMQPEELNSEGTYSLRASVPSPVMNVLCANLNEEELSPIIYNKWPNNKDVTMENWDKLRDNATTKNKTVVDEIFGWKKKDDKKMTDYPPVFGKIPIAFNTIMNHTSASWGREAVYLLGSGGNMDDGTALNGTYALCKIHVTLTSRCSTQYNATGSGGTIEALCEDRDPGMAYIKSNASEPDSTVLFDWRDIAFDWANSLSLNTGIMDGAASNSRLLTQLMLKENDEGEVDLSPRLPSPAEALAVMAGCTLLMSSIDSPFVMFWNYTTGPPLLSDYVTQYFNASVKAQQYASGGVGHVSKGWMVILFLVFLMNILVLVYFLFHKGLVTDFSEPPNLFALAVNSPPSQLFAGSCGGGPGGKQYVVNWFVNTEGDHLYMEPGQKNAHEHMERAHSHPHSHPHPHPHPHASASTSKKVKSSDTGLFSGITASIMSPLNRLQQRGLNLRSSSGQQRLRPASVVGADMEMEDGHTETQRHYARLSKRTSML